nr:ClassA_beta_lactamase [uncultured bacterium]AIA17144.1 ClassA_beta_lactamase [uncultured bacterium]
MQLAVLLLCLLAVGCANGQGSVRKDARKDRPRDSERPARPDDVVRQKTGLEKQFEEIARKSGGRVGVRAMLLATGETFSLNENERFPMQSVYKLPIAMAVFGRIEAGTIKLEQMLRIGGGEVLKGSTALPAEKYPDGTERSVEELLGLMVSESDNTASDALLRLAGGPREVMNYLKKLGINDMVVANFEKEMHADWQAQYRNYATPSAAVELLRAIDEANGISPPNKTRLLKFLTESPTGPRRLKGLLPEGAVVAHKTGTSATRNNLTPATNDIGILTLPDGRRFAIAVFVADSSADQATREETIARITRAAWTYWSEK